MKRILFKSSNQKANYRTIDCNSLKLLGLLTVPAGIMALILFLWTETYWIAEIPYTAIGIFGSFVALLLSVFIIARYQEKSGVLYISTGLMAMAIINGVQSVLPPEASEFVWLHSISGIYGGLFFVLYVLSETTNIPIPRAKATTKWMRRLLGGVAVLASLSGILVIAFPETLPAMIQYGRFSSIAWIINILPIGLFLCAGTGLFRWYRKAATPELFLFTAIVIFLFQASEVFYFASLWSVIWWFWLALRVVVYLTVLVLLLGEYIQTGNHLAKEIEERRKVELALRKADADWTNCFNSLDEVMMVIDRDYKIENINSSGLELLQQDKDEILGRKCYQVFHGEKEPVDYCPLRRTLETGEVATVERYDEQYKKHLSMKSLPILNDNGQVTKAVYLASDITKSVMAEEKEKLLQRELNLTSRLASIGEVAAGITHEINNPLTSVIAFAQILEQKELPDDIKEAVEVINDSADRISGIVDKLLTFARRHKQEKVYADINAVISSVIVMRSYEMRNNNVSVITHLDPDLPGTMANEGELQQVFLNIIINAEQAIAGARHREGKITVKSETVDDLIRITIGDDGPGVPEEYIDKLFDPFFTTKESQGGTGLGLSISYGIISEHGGKIRVNSQPGNGTNFTIDIPIVAEFEKVPELSVTPAEEPDAASAKILIVDDEKNICQALDRILSEAGHEVDSINDAREALHKLNRVQYDIILLDIRMPGMDGIDFYNRIKAIEPSLQNKVICITGDIISTRNRSFLDKTGVPCITKPFTVKDLMQQVKLVIGGKVKNEQIAYSRS